jgi:hypothetical protein
MLQSHGEMLICTEEEVLEEAMLIALRKASRYIENLKPKGMTSFKIWSSQGDPLCEFGEDENGNPTGHADNRHWHVMWKAQLEIE